MSQVYQGLDREARRDELPVLVVPQLWIWQVGKFVVTAHPLHETGKMLDDAGGRGSRVPYHYSYWSAKRIGSSPTLLAGLLVAEQIRQFGLPQAAERFPPILQLFETATFTVMAELNEYTDPLYAGERSMNKESMILRRLDQIGMELLGIRNVLLQQGDVLQSVTSLCRASSTIFNVDHVRDMDTIESAASLHQAYLRQVDKIISDATRVGQTVQAQLDLMRTHASMQDTRNGLVLGVAVAGFTVVTIIFTPLAFVASLFALSIDKFVDNQYDLVTGTDSTRVYRSAYIGKWFGE